MSDDWQQLIAQTRRRLSHAPGFNKGPINVGDGERVASAVGGLALVGYGLKRRDGWGAAAALGGLALLHRGYTGYCAVGDLVGRDSSAPERHVRGAEAAHLAAIPAAPEAVYAAWADPTTRVRLVEHLAAVLPEEGGGETWQTRLTAQALGLPATVAMERVIDQPGQALAWRSTGDGPIAVQLTVGIEPAAGGSRVRAQVAWRPTDADHARRLHPDLGQRLEAELARGADVLRGLLAPRADDALSAGAVEAAEE